jgi:hypothetical protein
MKLVRTTKAVRRVTVDAPGARMIEVILISLGVGTGLGVFLGWKMGRGYERLRPNKKKRKDL